MGFKHETDKIQERFVDRGPLCDVTIIICHCQIYGTTPRP